MAIAYDPVSDSRLTTAWACTRATSRPVGQRPARTRSRCCLVGPRTRCTTKRPSATPVRGHVAMLASRRLSLPLLCPPIPLSDSCRVAVPHCAERRYHRCQVTCTLFKHVQSVLPGPDSDSSSSQCHSGCFNEHVLLDHIPHDDAGCYPNVMYSINLTIPDVNCDHCVLQVLLRSRRQRCDAVGWGR